MRRRVLALASIVVISASAFATPKQGSESLGDNTDFRAQIFSTTYIRALVDHIELYREENGGRNPATLELLCDKYGMGRKFLVDGWGRSIVYYASTSTYTLASLGRNGIADSQAVTPGGIGPEGDYDSDIVWIGDNWAQTPYAVDR